MYFIFILLTFFLVSCVRKEKKVLENIYTIYYLDSSLSSIVPLDYEAKSITKEALIEELMREFNNGKKTNDLVPALEEKVTFMSYYIKENVLYLNFDINYSSMKPTREILARAAIVKTFTGIDGIEFIGINSNEQAIKDAKGNPLPIFYAGEFIDSIVDVNSFERKEFILYFANNTGDKLVPERREIVYNINNKLEKLIIEELMKGPRSDNSKVLFNSEVKLNNISIKDNTCYIDFDDKFINFLNRPNAELLLYSIVNSISELGNVNKVQFTINGNTDYKFPSGVDISKAYDRNLDYIEE